MLVLSKHFCGVNSDFCANFINQNSFCDIRENTPKSYGMGLSPPSTGKLCSFVTFLLRMASLRWSSSLTSSQLSSGCCCSQLALVELFGFSAFLPTPVGRDAESVQNTFIWILWIPTIPAQNWKLSS